MRDLSRRRYLPENIYNTRINSQCVGFAVGEYEGEGVGPFVGSIVGLLDGALEGAEAQRRTHDKARGERFVEKKKIARKYI